MFQLKRRFLPITAVPALVALGLALTPAPADAKATYVGGVRLNSSESALFGYINDARRKQGLATLQISPGTTDVARRWAAEMARTEDLHHNPRFGPQVGSSGSPRWSVASENVGYASACDPKQLFDAYMNSAGHRKNILDPRMHYVGIGSVDRADPKWSCGVLWNTMNFVDSYTPSSYGTTRVPAWGLRVDQYAPSGATSVASFESGHEARMQLTTGGTLAKSAMALGRPTSGDDAVRLTFRSSGKASGTVTWELRDAWALSQRTSLTFKARLQSDRPTNSVLVEVRVADAFNRETYVGSFRARTKTATTTITLPSSARAFGNTLRLRVTNDAVRAGSASGRILHLYGIGVS